MSIDKVRAFFARYEMEDRVRVFPVSSATVALAAQAVGASPARIAKTLSFRAGEGCLLVVTAGNAKVDNALFKEQFHTKARMLSADEVRAMTGFSVGGVCPFGLPAGIPIYLDVSLRRFETVFPACGSDNSAIELTPQELDRLSGAAGWVDVCKGWREDA